MVKKKRMAGIAIVVVGLVLGLLAIILDLITTGKANFGPDPLFLLIGGLLISVLGAVYIGAGTNEAVRLLNKQVKIMKGELADKEKTIGDQKKNLEGLSDARLTGLSQTVDRLDMYKKEEAAAEAKEKAPEAPPKPAWEKKPHELPPPPPKSMVAPGPSKPKVAHELPPPPPRSMVAPGPMKPAGPQELPPPPPKGMQVPVPHKPVETAPPPVFVPRPVEAQVPPKPVAAPLIAVPIPRPEPAKPEAATTPPPKPAPKEKELIEEKDREAEEDGTSEEDLLPSTTCPKCKNTFRGDWDKCPFCDNNLRAIPKEEPPKPEPAETGGGLSILGFTPKKEQPPAPAPPVEKPPEERAPLVIPPVPTLDRALEPPNPMPEPVAEKPGPSSMIPPLPEPPKATPPIPAIAKDKCPGCGKSIKSHWRNCPYCKTLLKQD